MQWHHKVVLEAGAKAIAAINGYEFGGQNERPPDRFDRLFFVPDDTLLVDEASYLGIRSPRAGYHVAGLHRIQEPRCPRGGETHAPARTVPREEPFSASGKDQTLVSTLNELNTFLERVAVDGMATYGLVLEEVQAPTTD